MATESSSVFNPMLPIPPEYMWPTSVADRKPELTEMLDEFCKHRYLVRKTLLGVTHPSANKQFTLKIIPKVQDHITELPILPKMLLCRLSAKKNNKGGIRKRSLLYVFEHHSIILENCLIRCDNINKWVNTWGPRVYLMGDEFILRSSFQIQAVEYGVVSKKIFRLYNQKEKNGILIQLLEQPVPRPPSVDLFPLMRTTSRGRRSIQEYLNDDSPESSPRRPIPQSRKKRKVEQISRPSYRLGRSEAKVVVGDANPIKIAASLFFTNPESVEVCFTASGPKQKLERIKAKIFWGSNPVNFDCPVKLDGSRLCVLVGAVTEFVQAIQTFFWKAVNQSKQWRMEAESLETAFDIRLGLLRTETIVVYATKTNFARIAETRAPSGSSKKFKSNLVLPGHSVRIGLNCRTYIDVGLSARKILERSKSCPVDFNVVAASHCVLAKYSVAERKEDEKKHSHSKEIRGELGIPLLLRKIDSASSKVVEKPLIKELLNAWNGNDYLTNLVDVHALRLARETKAGALELYIQKASAEKKASRLKKRQKTDQGLFSDPEVDECEFDWSQSTMSYPPSEAAGFSQTSLCSNDKPALLNELNLKNCT
ncbi:hypothetical protein AAMO2058_000724000 [Amorphochlora amoebiformis]